MQNNVTKALLALLQKSIVNFTYRKVDGSVRTAVGTRNLCLACQALGVSIPMPKSGRNNPTAYYDLEKGAWRSFVAENVLSINGVELAQIKGVSKGGDIVKVGSPEEVEIPINLGGFGGGFGGGLPLGGTPSGKDKEPASFDLGKIAKAVGGGLPLGGGFGGGNPIGGGVKGELPSRNGKVGTPVYNTDGDVALPIGGLVSIEDFAKLVAKYVVDLLAYRLTNN